MCVSRVSSSWNLIKEILFCNFTEARLMQKGVESDNCCVHCGAVGESGEHVPVHCSYAQSCWEELGIQTRMTSNVSFPQWFFSYFQLLDENLLLKFAVVKEHVLSVLIIKCYLKN
jgi:hypothetical protein